MSSLACSLGTRFDELLDAASCMGEVEEETPGEKFMNRLQNIEHKLQYKERLSRKERRVWRVVRRKLRRMVRKNIQSFPFLMASKNGAETAASCFQVAAHGEKYGFCLVDLNLIGYSRRDLQRLLHRKLRKVARRKRKKLLKKARKFAEKARKWARDARKLMRKAFRLEQKAKRMAKKSRKYAREARETTVRTLSEDDDGYESGSDEGTGRGGGRVIYLDILGVENCDSVWDLPCGNYCCDPENHNAPFCTSNMPCY